MATLSEETEAPTSPTNPTSFVRVNTTTNNEEPLSPEEFEDEDEDEGFSDLDETVPSSTISLSDSIISYRAENGRTYHRFKDGKYLFPNDPTENERLDIQHHMLLLTFDNQLGTAPPNRTHGRVKVGRVLDIGTGTGSWAIDFADEHPESEVLGVDLSAIQPQFTPPNVKFEIADVEEDWTYSRPFQYIHSRNMNGSIRDWQQHIQNCYDYLTPNGYLEITECDFKAKSHDGTLTDDLALVKLMKMWGEAAASLGRPFQDIEPLADVMREIGFVDVQVTGAIWPSNSWPKDRKLRELGLWNLTNFMSGIEGFVMAPLTRAFNWSQEEVADFAEQVCREMRDTRIHYYTPVWSIYGRKPAKTQFAGNA